MRVPLIYDNPLRVLGVFSNATLREMEQNKAQLRAFARVGQEVQLPLWLNGLQRLPSLPVVTEEQLSQAQTQLALQADRDHYALFWFEQDNAHVQDEQEAIRLLNDNHVDEARQLWQQRTDHAAQKNLLLLAVLADDWNEIAVRVANCFEGDFPTFHSFMGEVVKWSPEASGPRPHVLLFRFKEETWHNEMKRVLTDHHKHAINEAVSQLQRTGDTSDAVLLRKSIDQMADEMNHVIALQNLLGSDSFVCSTYSNEAAKALLYVLFQYGELEISNSERKWAAKYANELLQNISRNEKELFKLRFGVFQLEQKAQINEKAASSSDGSIFSSDGCLYPFLCYIFFLFIGMILRNCDGDKKTGKDDDHDLFKTGGYRYNIRDYPILPPDTHIYRLHVPDKEFKLIKRQGELYMQGIQLLSKDSIRKLHEELDSINEELDSQNIKDERDSIEH